jgi:hypothetical protein
MRVNWVFRMIMFTVMRPSAFRTCVPYCRILTHSPECHPEVFPHIEPGFPVSIRQTPINPHGDLIGLLCKPLRVSLLQ